MTAQKGSEYLDFFLWHQNRLFCKKFQEVSRSAVTFESRWSRWFTPLSTSSSGIVIFSCPNCWHSPDLGRRIFLIQENLSEKGNFSFLWWLVLQGRAWLLCAAWVHSSCFVHHSWSVAKVLPGTLSLSSLCANHLLAHAPSMSSLPFGSYPTLWFGKLPCLDPVWVHRRAQKCIAHWLPFPFVDTKSTLFLLLQVTAASILFCLSPFLPPYLLHSENKADFKNMSTCHTQI